MNEAKYLSAKHGLQGPQPLSYSIVVWLYKTLDDMFGVRTRVASIALGREHVRFADRLQPQFRKHKLSHQGKSFHMFNLQP